MTPNPIESAMPLQADAGQPGSLIDSLVANLVAPDASRSRLQSFLRIFLAFGIKEAWACLFGGAMVALLIATHFWYPANIALPRYDALTIAAVVIQILMLAFKLEEWDELVVILLFHAAGTCMELFKTSVGSWVYPEFAHLRIGGVPLFTGFMYASVGSYIVRARPIPS